MPPSPSPPKINPLLLFAREIFANPRAIGAVCPSSARLARAMAAQVPDTGRLVLELGAGTGMITEALLAAGVAPERLISLELSENLARHLRQRFPKVRVIHGDASHLQQLLPEEFPHIGCLISGLPLRSLPPAVIHNICEQIRPLTQAGAPLIQFTYDLRNRPFAPLESGLQLRRVHSRMVWRNLPPARVDVYQMAR